MNVAELKKVYFNGIGGIGMSGLAQLLLDHGVEVSGSDRDASPVTEMLEKKGISVLIGQKAENVPEDADVMVYSEAVWPDNTERVCAGELGIEQVSYFEMLGRVSEGKRTVAVSGTHGKTTTTGMLARVLRDADASPSAIVGSIVQDFGSNYLSGASDLFVVEACEYKRDFLTLSPEILVITNLELDHTDYYRDIDDIRDAFQTLIKKVPPHGTIVTDVRNPNIAPLLTNLLCTVVDYKQERGYDLRLPGSFNQDNARAAATAARIMLPTLSEEVMEASLQDFHGTWRRFEFKGKTARGAEVYDDYAHHPTAVAGTITELRNRTKGKLYIAFHPHLYSRTRDLLSEFATSFAGADRVFIAPIFAAREIDDGSVSSELLAECIKENGVNAVAVDTFKEIEQMLQEAGDGDVIATMGAGDIYKVSDALIKN